MPSLHAGHRALIESVLKDEGRVVVGLRDTKYDEGNPYSVDERRRMIHAIYDDVEFVVIPDQDCDLEIVYGRGVGYTFRQVDLPPELEAISGTAIRERKEIVWLTGNSGSGKTTLARNIIGLLNAVNLDGDEMRRSISVGAGFSIPERLEHNLRVARLAGVLKEQHNVVVSVIAPKQSIRTEIEQIIKPLWVYVRRDQPIRPDYPYDPPRNPVLTVNMSALTINEATDYFMEWWRGR